MDDMKGERINKTIIKGLGEEMEEDKEKGNQGAYKFEVLPRKQLNANSMK